VPNIDLKDYTEINQSGYFINYKQLLGKGRFGEVYLGYSKPDQIKMAVKKIPQST
jgi:serine/threonine protein kinase